MKVVVFVVWSNVAVLFGYWLGRRHDEGGDDAQNVA